SNFLNFLAALNCFRTRVTLWGASSSASESAITMMHKA
ncbi:MAG: hypothetical protein ACI90V_014325, partial [Bacillariaceae sp.]